MKRYYINAPQISRSNGVRALYRLAEILVERGYEAYMLAPPTPGDTKHIYINNITPEMQKNDIVVYPEIVCGNPCMFQNVVRWVLYFPGKNGGPQEYDDYEVPFTFFKEYYPTDDVLFIPTIDNSLFYYDGTPKDTDCYFVHKGGKWREIEEFNSMVEITPFFPSPRTELANLLRRTKTLYSYDRYSVLLDEARYCNCEVKLVEEEGFSDYVSEYEKYEKNFESYLNNFIEKTQKMNYQGPISGGIRYF